MLRTERLFGDHAVGRIDLPLHIAVIPAHFSPSSVDVSSRQMQPGRDTYKATSLKDALTLLLLTTL
jgi:hypothetical protein